MNLRAAAVVYSGKGPEWRGPSQAPVVFAQVGPQPAERGTIIVASISPIQTSTC